jgi:hypothetical protein
MKGYSGFSRGWGNCLLNIALIFLAGFLLLPAHSANVMADSDNASSTNITITDNSTISDNATFIATPIAPSELTSTVVSPSEVDLAWTDNSTDEIGFRIERADDEIFTQNLVSFTVDADKMLYQDFSVIEGNSYYYRVFAYNDAEDSAPSNVVCVTLEKSASDLNNPIDLSDNVTLEGLSASDNTTKLDEISDNKTSQLEPSDNLTLPTNNPNFSVKEVNPDEEALLFSPNGKIKLNIPKGAISKETKFNLKDCGASSSTGMKIVNSFELNATQDDAKTNIHQFEKGMELTIQNTAEELAGLDIDSLNLYYLDEKTLEWLPIPSTFDRETLTLTGTIDHFSHFGEQANPLQNGPGRVMASQVNLHSGASTYSYPFELPPGPGGFQPSLTLTYDSGFVDGMKNRRDAASWVGIGWSLSLGKISHDLTYDGYYLDLNGASYRLYSSDGTNYQTQPEQFLKILRSGNIWYLYDREGTLYCFGGTADSQQYIDTSNYYRWDLSYWKDTNNNQATVTYTQDIWNNTVRAVYPTSIIYGNVSILFSISNDGYNATDGYIRNDNPISTSYNPAPKIMETRKLNTIEVKVSNNLLRKYSFSYNTTNSFYSSNYGGIYYSGKHTLTSITQVGADGSSSVPATSFTYQDKEVFRKTSTDQYTGNPGNPASLTWPFLTAVNSGYGGSVGFSYTQIPTNTTFNLWTRQAVTTKTVNSGIGTTETYTYTYTGNPTYKGIGWNQEFKGWNEVKETDATGNYQKHYFFTTGTINGKDAEKLTGKEYQTRWYDSSNTLLDTKTYDWN